MNPGIIVIGGHVQGLGIIRIFGENGIPTILLDNTDFNIARHSKYCTHFFKISRETDLKEYLLEILPKKVSVKNWLLVPTHDSYVKVLSQNKDQLETYYRVSVDDWSIIENCYDKRLTYKIAQSLNISIPKTVLLENISNIDEIDIEYPCIIKPAIMHKFYAQVKSKVIVCNSKYDLIKNILITERLIPRNEIIIQEIIPGDPENQYSSCFFYGRNQPIVTLVARRKRQHPLDFGNATTFAETVELPELIETSKILLSHIRYWGVCEVEFKFDQRDKTFKLLEINPRTWKWHYIAKRSESPFLMSLYNAIYFNRPIYTDCWKKSSWRHLTTDCVVVLKQFLKGTLMPSNNNNIQSAVFNRSDILPSLFEIIYLPYIMFTR